MSLQIGLRLQTPSIELPVVARDAAGMTETITIGFKRYDVEETRNKFKQLNDIHSRITDETPDTTELDAFIRGEVLYVKKAEIIVTDTSTGIDKKISILDTRTIKPVENLWGSEEECVSLLLTAYLTSAPYRVSIANALSKALLNNDYKDASAKN
jgi:hypothetical protein